MSHKEQEGTTGVAGKMEHVQQVVKREIVQDEHRSCSGSRYSDGR